MNRGIGWTVATALLSMVLSACGGSVSTPGGGGAGTGGGGSVGGSSTVSISGKLSGYTGPSVSGTPDVLKVYVAQDTDYDGDNSVLLASAAVDSSGSFTLPLPSAQSLAPYLKTERGLFPAGVLAAGGLAASCTIGRFSSSNLSAQSFPVWELSLTTSGSASYIPTVGQSSLTTGTVLFWVYDSASETISGSETCTSGNMSRAVTFDVSLQPGWNVISLSVTSSSSTSSNASVTNYTGSLSNIVWIKTQ